MSNNESDNPESQLQDSPLDDDHGAFDQESDGSASVASDQRNVGHPAKATASICRPYMSMSNPDAILDTDQIVAILQSPDPSRLSRRPAVKPRAGDVFVYPASLGSDVRCDQYNWVNYGKKSLPKYNPSLTKHFFNCAQAGQPKGSFLFRRFEFYDQNEESRRYILVQYCGDQSVAQSKVHGNAKRSQRPFIRQSVAVKENISQSDVNDMPSKLYRRGVSSACSGPYAAVYSPRNLEKVRNVMKLKRQGHRFTHDAIYNLMELAYHLADQQNETITHIQVVPQLTIRVIFSDLLGELSDVLKLPIFDDYPLTLSYDTTYKIGPFYVSVLSFRHTLFRGSPVVPFGYLIHERKFQKDHNDFLEEVTQRMPKECRNKICIVTDREFAFPRLPTYVKQVYCWNHIYADVRRFVRYPSGRTPGTVEEASVYRQNVELLLKCETLDEFYTEYSKLSAVWSAGFLEYIDTNLKECVVNSAGRWILEPLNAGNASSGVTTNACESLNAVIKRLIEWRERPVDAAIYALFELSRSFSLEIARGKHGLGKYELRPGFTALPAEDLDCSSFRNANEDIVASIRHVRQAKAQCTEDSRASGSAQATSDVSIGKASATGLTQCAMANQAIIEKRVVHAPEAGAFRVTGSNGSKYAVTLFPKETCQCLAVAQCYHIIAAKRSIGICESKQPRKISLTALGKHSRKRGDKKSGRKRPRPGDCDVEPAPDSQKAVSASVETVCQNVLKRSPERSAPVPSKFPVVMSWGGGRRYRISNSCPVDNLLTILYFAGLQSHTMLDYIRNGSSAAEKALLATFGEMDTGNVDAAKDHWIELVKPTLPDSHVNGLTIDMHGSEAERCLNFFSEVYARYEHSDCSNDTCPSKHRCDPKGIPSIQHGTSVQAQVDQLFDERHVSCWEVFRFSVSGGRPSEVSSDVRMLLVLEEGSVDNYVSRAVCAGVRKRAKVDMRSSCWMLPLEVSPEWIGTDPSHFPLSINVKGASFYLRGATIGSGAGHFTCFIRFREEWLHFDGLRATACLGGVKSPKGQFNYVVYTV